MTHQEKVKLARRMNIVALTDQDGKIFYKQLNSGHFLSKAWQTRKDAIALRVAKRIEKIKKAKQK